MFELQAAPCGLSPGVVILRLTLAAVMGGIVGMERATRRQVSGMRTFALLSLGSALTVIINIYIAAMFSLNDPTRIPASAIGSIGFLGVGTIFVSGRGQVRGITTAAALWTVAVLGMAAGSGLYICSIATLVLVVLINHALVAVSHYQERTNREIVFYVELKKGENLKEFMEFLQGGNHKIISVEKKSRDVLFEDAVGLKVQINFGCRMNHPDFLKQLKELPGVYYLEEM